MTDQLYLVFMAKILILKNEGIIEKISYERRAYESVEDRSHSQVISQKSTRNKNSGTIGLSMLTMNKNFPFAFTSDVASFKYLSQVMI